jgi:putative molybdopterin biosynthesis protein
MIKCPDCGLVLRAIDDTIGFKCVYDIDVWRRICTRVDLGGAAWCLVQRDGTHTRPPVMDRGDRRRNIADLVMIGSHCIGLELIIERLQAEGLAVKVINVGSTSGLAAAERDECDVAPVHLMDPATSEYNKPFLTARMELVPGYRRLQGIVFRLGDRRFDGLSAEAAIAAARVNTQCRMINRNAGSGTRILIDRLLAGERPPGYRSQPNSHNAVAMAVAQGRADWGLTIKAVARRYDLGFTPVQDEQYDFVIPKSRGHRSPVQRFRALLQEPSLRAALIAGGFGSSPSK